MVRPQGIIPKYLYIPITKKLSVKRVMIPTRGFKKIMEIKKIKIGESIIRRPDITPHFDIMNEIKIVPSKKEPIISGLLKFSVPFFSSKTFIASLFKLHKTKQFFYLVIDV